MADIRSQTTAGWWELRSSRGRVSVCKKSYGGLIRRVYETRVYIRICRQPCDLKGRSLGCLGGERSGFAAHELVTS